MNQPLPVSDANHLLRQLFSHPSDIDQILPGAQGALLEEAAALQCSDRAAHMTPNLAPYSSLGMQLAALHQGNLLSAELYPLLKQAESLTLDWLQDCFGLPYAHFSHGGSYNNLQALWQARNQYGGKRRHVYASRACHYSIHKACDLLGLELQLIDTDDDDRISVDKLAHACAQQAPLALVLTVGTPAMGSIDAIDTACRLAQEYQSWLHIDASWGGALMLLPENQTLTQLASQADSLCFDPHKSLFQPRPCSIFLSRHSSQQRQQTDYLSAAPVARLAGSYGGELFLPLWLNLQLLGQDWFLAQTRARLHQAERFTHTLMTQGLTVKNGGTGIVCFQGENLPLDKLVASGFFSEARVDQQHVYRAVFASSLTQSDSLFRALHPFL